MTSLDTSKLNKKRQAILKGVKKVPLKKTIDVLLDAYDENTALHQIIEDQEEKIKNLEATNKPKKSAKTELKKTSFSENEVDTIEALTSLTNMYSSQVKDLLEMKVVKQVSVLKLEEKIEKLELNLEAEKHTVAELQVKIDHLEVEKNDFIFEAEQSAQKMTKIEGEVVRLQGEVDSKNDQITTVIAANEKLKKDIEQLKNPSEDSESEMIVSEPEPPTETHVEH